MDVGKPKYILLHPADNVAVAAKEMAAGEPAGIRDVVCRQPIAPGHKIALEAIDTGEAIRKYGDVIGCATKPIERGDHVHLDNMAMVELSQDYTPGAGARPTDFMPDDKKALFEGFVRADGAVGTRNYIAVISTVSCSGSVARFIADAVSADLLSDFPQVDGVVAVAHGAGCCHSPGSEGLLMLQRTLAGYARNPNFGGVLLVGLGCEVNLVGALMDTMGLVAYARLRPLVIQEVGGTRRTVEAGLAAVKEMLPAVNQISRRTVPADRLVVGLECGGSDAYSGITANPALGAAVDLLVRHGGTAILSETPEIYGAEHLLVRRAATPGIADQLLERIRWWEAYTAAHGARIDNNPTPGNKAGGITTILEKSMGAVAKAGTTNLNAVYRFAEKITAQGLVFMDTPGYDVVSITGMIAGGANLVCFTTGRGTVCGFKPVPTLKLASNTAMFNRMEADMDINCGHIMTGETTIAQIGAEIFGEMLTAASGRKTKSELLGFGDSEFVPWHYGAVL